MATKLTYLACLIPARIMHRTDCILVAYTFMPLQILLKELQAEPYSDGLRDQNAVIYLLKTHPEWQDRVLFQDKEICLNCYWQDLIGVTGYGKPSYDRVENVSFPRPLLRQQHQECKDWFKRPYTVAVICMKRQAGIAFSIKADCTE